MFKKGLSNMATIVTLLGFFSFLTFFTRVCLPVYADDNQCPDPVPLLADTLALRTHQSIDTAMVNKTFTFVKSIRKDGLCVGLFKQQGSRQVNEFIYTPDSKYTFLGEAFDLGSKGTLAGKEITEIEKLSAGDIKKLDELVVGVSGKSKNFVYMITDPDCPFCKKMEAALKPYIDKGELTLKIILYPLSIHPNALDHASSIVCSSADPFVALMSDVYEKPCSQGQAKIIKNLQAIKQFNLSSVPTFIAPDGKIIIGMAPVSEILSMSRCDKNNNGHVKGAGGC